MAGSTRIKNFWSHYNNLKLFSGAIEKNLNLATRLVKDRKHRYWMLVKLKGNTMVRYRRYNLKVEEPVMVFLHMKAWDKTRRSFAPSDLNSIADDITLSKLAMRIDDHTPASYFIACPKSATPVTRRAMRKRHIGYIRYSILFGVESMLHSFLAMIQSTIVCMSSWVRYCPLCKHPRLFEHIVKRATCFFCGSRFRWNQWLPDG